MDKGAGCNRIFEWTSIDVAAMLNRCWRLANEFTDFTAKSKTIYNSYKQQNITIYCTMHYK